MKLREYIAKSPTRMFWGQCTVGLLFIVGTVAANQITRQPIVELLCVLGLVLAIFGPTKLPDLGKSIKEAYDRFGNGRGGFGPPGVPVEPALCVPVQPKRKEPEPPLPPL